MPRIGVLGAAIPALFLLLALTGAISSRPTFLLSVYDNVLQAPSSQHWMRADHLGRYLFRSLIAGARTTLGLAFVIAVANAAALVPDGLLCIHHVQSTDGHHVAGIIKPVGQRQPRSVFLAPAGRFVISTLSQSSTTSRYTEERHPMPRLLPVLLLLVACFAAIPLIGQELNTTQLTQLARLEHRFMSPCCYGEPLYGHLSPQAVEMKQEIATMVTEGRTDGEIVEHFKAKFGVRILVEPEGAQWWIMNVVPVVLLLIGLAFTVWIIRKWYRPAAPREA